MNYTPLPSCTDGHYVYLHTKASEPGISTRSLFYVGKGVMPKDGNGLNRAWKTEGRSEYWQRVTRKHGRLIWIVQQGMTPDDALELEHALIEFARDCGCRLANMNDGGFGGALTGNALEKMRSSLVARFSDEHARQLTSEATKKGMARPEVRLKLSQANMGKPRSDDVKAAIRAKLLGRRRTDAERDALAASWKDDPLVIEARLSSLGARKIECLETGQVFRSAGAAAAWVQSKNSGKGCATPILNCCKGIARTAYGYTWRYADTQ